MTVPAAKRRASAQERGLYRRLARNSAVLAAGTLASALFMMLAFVLSARVLTTHDFGVLILLQSATALIAATMSFGTQQPLIKLGSEAQLAGDRERLSRLVSLSFLLDLFAALIAAGLAFALIYLLGPRIGLTGVHRSSAFLFAGSLLFTGFLTANGLFRLFNRFGLLSLIQAGCAAVLLGATAILYSSGGALEQFVWAWAGFYAANGLVPLFVALYFARNEGVRIAAGTGGIRRTDLRTYFAYSWTTWGTSTLDTVRSSGDSLLVGTLVSVPAAGVYNVAKQLAGVLRKLNNVYGSAVFPEISSLSAQGAADSARAVRSRMLWISGLAGMVAVAAAAALGRPIIELLFGNRFLGAYLPLVILTGAAAAQLFSYTLSMYTQVYAGPEKLFQAYVVAIAIFVASAIPLTLLLSLSGTAIAQLMFSLALIGYCHFALTKTALFRAPAPAGPSQFRAE